MIARRDARVARWVLGAPLLAFLALLVVYPILSGVRTALQHRTLLDPVATWAGFGTVLEDAGFWHAVWFTLRFTVVVTVAEVVLGFALALLCDKHFPGKKGLLSALIMPIMIAPALMGVMFRLLHKVGIDVTLFGNGTVVPLLVILDIAQWTPFAFPLFYAGLQTVPRELYDAAVTSTGIRWGDISAATFLSVLPPLCFAVFAQRHLVSGLSAGAVKG